MHALTLDRFPVVEELSLLDRLRRGDLDAVADVYDLHHRTVGEFACRLLGDTHAAEDLVQDVFILLPKVSHKLKPGRSLLAFLLGIAANRARHHVRSRARRLNLEVRLSEVPQHGPEDPEQKLERCRLSRALSRAMDALPLAQRLAFVLCEVQDHSSREAAEILAVPEATVRTRLFHARRKLVLHLKREGIL